METEERTHATYPNHCQSKYQRGAHTGCGGVPDQLPERLQDLVHGGEPVLSERGQGVRQRTQGERDLMVHAFTCAGLHLALDAGSGALHQLDDLAYEVVQLFVDHSEEEIVRLLPQFDERKCATASGRCSRRARRAEMFTPMEGESADLRRRHCQGAVPARGARLQSALRLLLCLHRRVREHALPDAAGGGQAPLDFLIARSGQRKHLRWISLAASR